MPLCRILIGRELEMERLSSAIDGAGVITVTGEAGLGKSRLVREIAGLAFDRGRPVLWGRPEEVSVPGPYSLILDLLDNIAAKNHAASAEAVRLLNELVEPNVAQTSSPVSFSRQIAARLRGILGQMQVSPVVILEDLHAVDEASVAVVFHLAKSASDDGYLILGTYRPESVPSVSELGRALAVLEKERSLVEISLTPLGPEDTGRIIVEVLGYEPEAELTAAIGRLGEGVPFFIEELASITATGGELPDVPQTITRAIEQQLHRLNASTLDLVQTAALIEGPIDSQILREATAHDFSSTADSLKEARAAGILVDDEGLYRFRHTLVRRAISSSIARHSLPQFHRKIALSLEHLHEGDPSRNWQMALHWHGAGENERAASYATKAGRYALDLAATRDAKAAFESAQAWSTDIDVQMQSLNGLTLVAFREGQDQDAVTFGRRAVSALLAAGRKAEAAASLGRLALVLTRVDDPNGVAEALDEGLELLGDEQHLDVSARLLAQKGNFLIFYQRRFAEAETLVLRAAEMAERIEAHAIVAVANDGLAEIASWRGNFAESDRIGETSLKWAILSQDPEAIGRTHNNHAVRLVIHGRPQLGLSILGVGHDIMAQSFGSAGVSSLDITRAWIHQMMGEPNQALESLKNLESVWMAWRGLAAGIRAWALVERGDLSEAEVVLSRAWQAAGLEGGWRALAEDPSRATPDLLELLPAEVWFHAATRAFPNAAGAAHLHRTLSEEGGQTAEWARSAALLARVLARGGDTTGALRALSKLRDLLDQRPYPYFEASAREVEGLIKLASGKPDVASERFSSAADMFAACSNSADQARCHRAVADIVRQDGSRLQEAKERLGRSRDLAMRSGALDELSRSEAGLRSLGVRPRAGRPRKVEKKGELSAREEQIAALVAEGATNPEIARRLFISEGTVSGYVSTALRKLGLSSRAALAAWSAKAGLV
jgi:DNA-binding CsgD family transcriptional regulator